MKMKVCVIVFTVYMHCLLYKQTSGSCLDIINCECRQENNELRLMCHMNGSDAFDFQSLPADENNITNIEIYASNILFNQGLAHQTFNKCKTLSLNGNARNTKLTRGFVQQFKNVRDLHIRNCSLVDIEASAFHGLPNLQILDLSVNKELSLDSVENALEGLTSPQLKVVNLSLVHSPDEGGSMGIGRISHRLIQRLEGTSLEVFDISWSKAYFFEANLRCVPYLKYINITGTSIVGSLPCMTTMLALDHLEEMIWDYWPLAERNIVVPPRYKLSATCEGVPIRTTSGCYYLPDRLRTLRAQFAKFHTFYMDLTEPMCIQARGFVNLLLAGVALPGPIVFITGLNNLQVFDLTYPALPLESNYSAVGSRLFYEMPSLRVVLMPGCSLNLLSTSNLATLFAHNNHLAVLDLSDNHLTDIPKNMFINTTEMQNLNISRNRITHVNIDLNALPFLEVLDLSHNHITALDSNVANAINLHIHLFSLMMLHNRFHCDCTIDNIMTLNMSSVQVTCKNMYDEIEFINQTITSENKYPCIESNMINRKRILLVSLSLTSFTVSLVVFILWKRRQRRRLNKADEVGKEQPNFVHFVPEATLHVDNRNPEFISFIAYSTVDSDFVCNTLRPKLEDYLLELFPEHQGDILCLYDKHFPPGDGIFECIEQAVFKSYVLVAVITEAFLQSRWCSVEVEHAFTKGVPIIPLYIVQFDPNDYQGIMKYIFNRTIRLNWPVHNENELHGERELNIIRELAEAIKAQVDIQNHQENAA